MWVLFEMKTELKYGINYQTCIIEHILVFGTVVNVYLLLTFRIFVQEYLSSILKLLVNK